MKDRYKKGDNEPLLKKARPGAKTPIESGLFHIQSVTPDRIWPKDLVFKPCTYFCCIGKKFDKASVACNFKHYQHWDKMSADDQAKFMKYFAETGNG